ncbi:CoB--CoM heterodisulfide reductase iron-sulfur subunit B family protein [bacterium]|nr:CoB--CoM heterodisulfide reductase iron-sulfur subunit B family protein [bacterium]
MQKIAYYPGCTMKTTAKNFEDSAIAVFKKLGIELVEIPRWNCCGTVYSLTSDDLMHHLAPIRNLIRVKEMGCDKVVTFCSMCYNTLKQSNLRFQQNEEERQKINDFMYREELNYEGDVEIVQALEFLRDSVGFKKIAEKVKNPLNGLKVAPYYGCLLLRPKEASIDNPEDPSIVEDLIKSLGAEPVDFPYKNECCMSYLTVNHKDIVAERTFNIIKSAGKFGADMILTSCPLCEYNLDARQREALEKFPDHLSMPVLYFTQLMAMALGLDDKDIRFDLNYIKPDDKLIKSNI